MITGGFIYPRGIIYIVRDKEMNAPHNPRLEEIVFRLNSDSKSIVLIDPQAFNVFYAYEGSYGGYILRETNVDVEQLLAFYVEPSIEDIEIETYKHLLELLPEEVRKELNKAEKITYRMIRVKPIIKKKTDRYIVLDFQPYSPKEEYTAEAIRFYTHYSGSARHPKSTYAERIVKEYKLKYPDNKAVQKRLYAKSYTGYKGRDSTIYYKVATKLPMIKDLVATVDVKPQELDINEEEALAILKSWDSLPVATAVMEKEEKPQTPIDIDSKIAQAVKNYLEKQGLMKAKVVVFDLPTEYLRSETKYSKTEDGRISETKILTIDPARMRTLRKKFYNALHKVAFKTLMGWILLQDADLTPLNNVMKEIHEELKRYGIEDYRKIYILDTYIPRNYIIQQLKEYIEERRSTYQDLVAKMNDPMITGYKLKRLEKQAEQLLIEIKRLEKELKNLIK